MRVDPFECLGLPARFDLDPRDVERAYLLRTSQVHPDRHDDDEATEFAARLNHARWVLRDDERRADALLLRMGGPTKEDDRSLPAGFLMEIMEQREAADDAIARRDAQAIARSLAWAWRRRADFVEKVGRLFAATPGADPRAIRRELNAWRYIERMIEQLSTSTE